MKIAAVIGCVVLVAAFSLQSCKKARTGKSTYDDYNAAVEKGIKKQVKDKDRRNKLRALHAKNQLQQVDTALIFAATGIQMRHKINLTREEAAEILAASSEQRLAALKTMSATRQEMRALVSKDEWDNIFTAAKQAQGGE